MWASYANDIAAILSLKRELNAVILAHNYQTPEIFHGVADIVGDSLTLARQATTVDADVIVVAGVRFMAETAKLLNPEKTVLLPDLDAGCSLAESIYPEDVRRLRRSYPGVPIVAYINTTAAVKAEADICCTSGNARQVVESLGTEHVIMLPDEYLAKNVAMETAVKIIPWRGHCEVHEKYQRHDIVELRENYPGIAILAHPECPPDVVAASDFSGSTSAMSYYIEVQRPSRVMLMTECSMSDNLAVNFPNIEFVRPCNLCPHMKRITLSNIVQCLQTKSHEIIIEDEIAEPARKSIERMLAQ